MQREEEDWPQGPGSMDWTTALPVEQVISADIRKRSVVNAKRKRVQDNGPEVAASSFVPRRKDIKIVENRLLVPPLLHPVSHSGNSRPNDDGGEWRSAPKRINKIQIPEIKSSLNAGQVIDTPESGSSVCAFNQSKVKTNKTNKIKSNTTHKFNLKSTKNAVVTVTGKSGGATYAQILSKAKQSVSLASLGIQNLRMRRAMNGALIMELGGPDRKKLAGSLRNCLEKALQDDAIVRSPVSIGEIRLRGIDPATSQEEISYELEKCSGCPPRDLKVSFVNTMRDGIGVAWARCPLEYAIRIAEQGSITLGWTVVRVELMKKRPIQCFRCWKFGHVRTNCRSEIDRMGMCFRCGEAGHPASKCSLTPKCVICAEINCESGHRIGSTRCLRNQGFPREVQDVRRITKSAIGGTALDRGV